MAPLIPLTHLAIDPRLVGTPLEIAAGTAVVALVTLPEMAADELGLVHGGFVFGLADYAAMLAVNHPNVVLAGSEVRFLKPVVVGERVVASAVVEETAGKKIRVRVSVRRGEEEVLTGSFLCLAPERHVLEGV
ncbi:MAG TPA: hotdog domain-containing protein [Thermoanaerobaculia bacterium]|jgi:acyl-coenzyme A thioesterase PaaI-like protein|nr:hotdog domain-containing protein [Thermoanaerobaculia bacterium]